MNSSIVVVIVLLCTLIVFTLVLNFVSIKSIGGYKIYFNLLKMFLDFKKIDYKIKTNKQITYQLPKGRPQVTKIYPGSDSYSFISDSEFIRITQTKGIYFLPETIISRHNYNEDTKQWSWVEHRINIGNISDLLLKFLYKNTDKKIKNSDGIEIEDGKEYESFINNEIIKKKRAKNLDSILS